MKNDQTVEYYQKRAEEYDKIYYRDDPVRQGELAYLYSLSKRVLNDQKVLDIACGTGFWTKIISESASSILGMDINESTLKVAESKEYNCDVSFSVGDFLKLESVLKNLTGLLATFVISHVKREDLPVLLSNVKRVLPSGAPIFLCDNNLICELKPELIADAENTNTYKKRVLENGEEYTILKNYFEPDELKSIFSDWGTITEFYFEKYYWAIALNLA